MKDKVLELSQPKYEGTQRKRKILYPGSALLLVTPELQIKTVLTWGIAGFCNTDFPIWITVSNENVSILGVPKHIVKRGRKAVIREEIQRKFTFHYMFFVLWNFIPGTYIADSRH